MIYVSLLSLKCYFTNQGAASLKMSNLDNKSLYQQPRGKVRLYLGFSKVMFCQSYKGSLSKLSCFVLAK